MIKLTIAIALKDIKNNQIIIGTDKQATCGQVIYKTNDKLIEVPIDIIDGYGETIDTKTFHIALSGNLYLGSFLSHGFVVPPLDENQKFMDYLYQDFLPSLRQILQEDNLIAIDNNISDMESSFIIVFDDEIYNVNYRLGIDIIEQEYLVIGSGTQMAIGSLYTNLNYHNDISYKEIVKQAIETCGENTIYCDSNPVIKIIKYK